jgi:signal transduction histidine kinase
VKRKQTPQDPRVKRRHFTWRDTVITYFILLTLATGQFLIYAEYMTFREMPPEYIFGMLGYWAIVTGVFCLVTARQKIKTFDRPMQTLSEAAKEVAKGDFSVYVEPFHPADKHDYVDVMCEDFNKMVEELGSIETLKNDFIGNVSHEIKTPLAIIQNYASALRSDTLTVDERREYSDTIITASRKLTGLVTNILKLNKLENQAIAPIGEPFDICRQLADCALAFEDVWGEKYITLEVDIEDKAVIRADESMLEIVWNNLLSNALKFTEPGGKITLRQTSDEDSVTVSVSDTGCGMDDETIKHIFDKFYQGDASRSQHGNGLGLALVLKIIELAGGQISAKSEPQVGTTFTVRLKV